MIEENKGPDHLTLGEWQHAPYFEAAEIAAALVNHQIQHRR
jgi:hypothetical protein